MKNLLRQRANYFIKKKKIKKNMKKWDREKEKIGFVQTIKQRKSRKLGKKND